MTSAENSLAFKKSFSALPSSVKAKVAAKKPLQQALAALAVAREGQLEYLSADEISAGLEAADIACDPESIRKALSRAGKKIKSLRFDGVIRYKAMLPGLKEIEPILDRGNIEVYFIQGGRPRSDRKRLAEILSQLEGTVRISDPYYGLRSLDALEMIPAQCKVLFLTAKTPEDPIGFVRHATDLIKERPQIQIRLYPESRDLHDRYVLTTENLLIVGHGLKDIGTKESFLIKIGVDVAPDLLSSVEVAFDGKWTKAKQI